MGLIYSAPECGQADRPPTVKTSPPPLSRGGRPRKATQVALDAADAATPKNTELPAPVGVLGLPEWRRPRGAR